ncbi:MAG: hypothetical protein C0490_00710 [Marivirga sp.]|nr:hypothetical protein [Marivirga sp.]
MQKLIVATSLLSFLFSCGGDDVDPVDCEVSGPILSLGTVVDAASCSITNGSIKATATGGKEPYEYSLNDQPGQSSGQFDNLGAGIYTIFVKDGNGCIKSVDNVTLKAADFTFNAGITEDNSCLSGNGIVTIDVADGNPPYTYKLGNGTFTDNNTFSELSVGTYSIFIKDINDCTTTLSVTVPRGFTGVSWAAEIKPIMETSCALSGCHNGSRPDLRKYENAKFYAKQIKSKTQDRSMPAEGTLTQQQINIIACWVDDGAFEN